MAITGEGKIYSDLSKKEQKPLKTLKNSSEIVKLEYTPH